MATTYSVRWPSWLLGMPVLTVQYLVWIAGAVTRGSEDEGLEEHDKTRCQVSLYDTGGGDEKKTR